MLLLLVCPSLLAQEDTPATNPPEKAECPFVCMALVEINGAPLAVLSNVYTGEILVARRHRYGAGVEGWALTGADFDTGVVTVAKFGKVFSMRVGQGVGDVPLVAVACEDSSVVSILGLYARLTGETILPAPGLRGTVTIIAPGPVPRSIAPDILTSAIEMAGYTFVRLPHATKVVPIGEGAGQPVPLSESGQ
jgi:hypothetical protein